MSVKEDGTLALSGVCDEVISSTAITLSTWQHILLRFSEGYCTLYLDGVQVLGAEMSDSVITSSIQLGGFVGYMDEFVFRNSASSGTPKIPSAPYNATFDVGLVGGFGTGSDGDITISVDCYINSSGLINSITDAKTFSINSWASGIYPASEGRELMIHITAPISTTSADYPYVGLYAFSKIASIENDINITLEDEITSENGFDFTLDSSLLSEYYIQVITVPHFNTLTIKSEKTVKPRTWSTYKSGGIVAFRCKGDCTIRGSIITHGRGAVRYDWCQMENSKLIDRFLCAQGGGIFITCGGTFTTSESARLGASWSGEGDGSNGAAGYGGKSGATINISSTQNFAANSGGVGGGGGGTSSKNSSGGTGGKAGSDGSAVNSRSGGGGGCGGNGASINNLNFVSGSGGGGQGNSGGKAGTNNSYEGRVTTGNNGTINGGDSVGYEYKCAGGGGGPGGNGGTGYWYTSSSSQGSLANGVAGACIVILYKIFSASIASISTGGSAGESVKGYTGELRQPGGGGSGFCYISAEELQ